MFFSADFFSIFKFLREERNVFNKVLNILIKCILIITKIYETGFYT